MGIQVGLQNYGCSQVIQVTAAFSPGNTKRPAGGESRLSAISLVPQHYR
jgi:hypothetical protein